MHTKLLMKSIVRVPFRTIWLTVFVLMTNCDNDSIVVNSNGNVSNTNFKAEVPFSTALDVVNHNELRLEGINGTIVITQSSEIDSVIINGVRRVESESVGDAQSHMADLQVHIDDLGDEILIKTEQPNVSKGRNYVVDYTITMPDEMDIVLLSVNGPLDLNEISSNVAVILVNGTIHCDAILPPGGTISMNLTNGSINLNLPEDTSANLSASVVNGSISTSGLTLQDLVQTTHSLSGKCGEGDGTITLNAVNGIIQVSGF